MSEPTSDPNSLSDLGRTLSPQCLHLGNGDDRLSLSYLGAALRGFSEIPDRNMPCEVQM